MLMRLAELTDKIATVTVNTGEKIHGRMGKVDIRHGVITLKVDNYGIIREYVIDTKAILMVSYNV